MINVELHQSNLMTTLVFILVGLNSLFLLFIGGYVIFRLRGSGSGPIAPIANFKRYILGAALTLVLLYLIYYLRDILFPFVIAFFLASLLDPVVTNLEKRNIPRWRGVLYIFAGVFVMFALLLVVALPKAVSEIKDIVSHSDEYERVLLDTADHQYVEFRKPLEFMGLHDTPSKWVRSKPVVTAATAILLSVKDALVGAAGRVLWLVIIPLSLFYFLNEFQVIRSKLINLLPETSHKNVDRISSEVVEIFSRYIRGLAKVCMMYGATVGVVFMLLGMPYFFFLGLAAGVLYAVPYVGPFLAVAGTGAIALANGRPPGYAITMVVVFLVIHFAFDYGLTPRIIGKSVNMHPLLNIFALMIGATQFGVIGMLLAVPVAASIQTVLIYFFPRLAVPPSSPDASLMSSM
ncbi:MAG: AI-2E family transporter [Chthonomonadales bacterium]